MSQRFYVVPLETIQTPDGSAWRPALPFGASFVSLSSSNPDGTPRLLWVVCLVDTDDHAAVEAYGDVISLGLSPDSPMRDVPNNQRNQYRNRLRNNGYDITINWNTDTAQDVFDRLAAIAEPTYQRGKVRLG